MTRAPIVKMPTVQRAGELRDWVLDKKNFEYIQSELSATSRFARLQEVFPSYICLLLYPTPSFLFDSRSTLILVFVPLYYVTK